MKNNFKRIAAFLLALGVVIPQSALLEGFSVNAIEETDAGEFLCEESGFQPDSEEVEKEIAVLAELNDGVSPEISTNNDNVVEKIEGVLSEETIESSWDVKELISNIDDLLGVENINQQLKFEDSSDGLYNTVYKFKQCYEGIEILNSSISIVVDKKTKIGKFLNSSFIPGFSIDINPDILSDDAAEIVVDKYSVGISQDPKLVIFQNADEEHRLAWYIITDSTSPSEVYVDAKNGDILYEKMPYGANEEGDVAAKYTVEKNNPLPEPFTVDIARDKDDADLYKLHDTRRNIYILDSQDISYNKNLVISKKYNDWTSYETELAVLHNVQRAYDFYKSLDWYSYDNECSDIFVIPSLKDENGNGINNAYAYFGLGGMSFGAGRGSYKNWGLSYDIAVHEYTHLVTDAKADFDYVEGKDGKVKGESASLSEAYSDIMAEYADGTDEWQFGTYHNLNGYAVRDLSEYPKYEVVKDFDTLECHAGGKVIGHAAYLMQEYCTSTFKDDYAALQIWNDYALQIWYESLCFLDNDATFLDCRTAVLEAATDVFYNNNVPWFEADDYMRKIKAAFNKVNVIDSSDNIGDINLDGNIDENDFVLLKNYINTKEVSLNSLQKYYADLTFDSKIDNSDLDVLINQVSPITITKQPINAFAKAGETVELSVSAEGEELNYKWYYCNPDSNVFVDTGVRRSECTIKMSDTVNGRKYYCKITGKFGNSVSTEEVTLTKILGIPVNIIQQPANATAKYMCGASTKVVAEGDMLTYKWYELEPGKKEFELISIKTGEKGGEYTRRMIEDVNGTRVYCEISDMYENTVRTDTIMLIEEGVPVKIIDQPTNVLAEIGSTVKTTVIAAGEELSYQWYVKNPGDKGFSKSSITKSEYITSMREEINGRKIYCVITDKYKNSIQTDTVTIGLPLELKTDLDNVSVKMGEKLKTSIEATGCGLTYTWYYKNKEMSDFKVTNSFKGDTYDFDEMTEERDGRQIYCVISDIFGNSVKTKTVTLGVPVEITKDLVDVTAKLGQKVNFSVSATGHGLTYKWYFKNKDMKAFDVTNTFKTNNYGFDQITPARAGREVYCVITDIFGNSVQTNTIKIDLPTGYGDANCDGKLTEADASAILQALANSDKFGLSEQGMINADFSGDNIVTAYDAELIKAYLAN